MNATVPNQMHAAAIDRFGGPEEIATHTLAVPQIGPGEILIRVETAGVGVWDPMEREGEMQEMMGGSPHFPHILGSDGAGTVAAVGGDVTRFRVGDRVYGFGLGNEKGGFYAEYVALNAENASCIPGSLSIEQAGAMPFDAMTALRGLEDELRLKRGESILIFGASGGIGHIAVQLAKRMGARVLAVASGDDGVALCRELGADAVIDGHRGDVAAAASTFAPDGLDAALFTAGSEQNESIVRAIRSGGRVAYPNGVQPAPKGREGVIAKAYDGMPDQYAIERLNRWIETGPFQVHVAKTFTLDKAAEAQRMLDQHYVGKMVLRA